MTFAWQAGKDPTYLAYAIANMTGANRVLIGLGWASLVFVHWGKTRDKQLPVSKSLRMELGFLMVATIYSFILPIKGTLSILDSIVFVAIFAAYVGRALGSEGGHHDLVGPAMLIDSKVGDAGRRSIALFFLVYACFAIWIAAHPFANGLVHVGRGWGIDEFILIQLVAPIASEAPEFIVAIMFVLRLRASTALGALVSSKVNQWTLLVGMLPIVYGISLGQFDPMILDSRQQSELLLTSSQSLFAIAVLANMSFSLAEATALAVLFIVAWFFPSEGARAGFSVLYLLGAAVLGFGTAQRRKDFTGLLRLWARHE
jgi:cation:H+ antiporter